jgi:phthiocerol/phenolphthiocerol synthesis type-I polyketide synthase B
MSEPGSSDRGGVAIVGIGCRFPGGVSDPAGFWRLLVEGRDAVGEIPRDRIDVDGYYDPRAAQPGRIVTRRGGFLDRIDEFDAEFFGISPREVERVDPQQRLLCEVAWEAFEDAGQDMNALAGSRTGVYVGQWLSDFEARLFAEPAEVDFYMTLGSGRYATSGRLSYVFDLRGPSVTLDTACSSSLAAVHLAAKSVASGESQLALAGGVNVILQPHITIAYSQSRMMAPDGRCKFGDASADGYVRSEGAALVVLKRLDCALSDGDRVYAVIRGSATSNDGRSSGSMGTVSRQGQEDLLRAAYRDAGVSPGAVGYVEAHGTGTQGGDPVELEALGVVLSDGRPAGRRAWVGSVKTNIGHTESAAGVAGLIKAALALRHGTVPGSLHLKDPNPKVPWARIPIDVPREPSPWPEGAGPRIAAVNAFGIAGSNAHVVLEEAPEPVRGGDAMDRRTSGPALLLLSARGRAALGALSLRYAELLERPDGPALHDVCSGAAFLRTALEHRAVFVAEDRATMAALLRRFAGGDPATAEGVARGRPKVVFVLPGQGAQWVGMGRELLAREPVFQSALERCEHAMRRWTDVRLIDQLHRDPGAPHYRLGDIDAIQPALVALSLGYAELLRSYAVEPDAVVGHSMGEVGAAFLSGAIDLDRATQIVCRRSALMRRAAGRGAMALVELPFDETQRRIARHAGKVAVAGNNSPRASVISGDPEPIRDLLRELEADGIFCRQIKVDVASHSPQMEPLAAELAAELADLAPAAARIPMYSTVLARRAEGAELIGDYWGENLRQTVLFGQTIERLLADGADVFVELGPHPVLLPSIQQQAQAAGRAVSTIACGKREEPEQASMLAAGGALWAAGYPVDLRRVLPPIGRRAVLPLYPWQRERHWVAAADRVQPGSGARAPARRPDDDALGWLHRFAWIARPFAEGVRPDARGAWLVASPTAIEGEALAGALVAAGARAHAVSLETLEAAVERHRASDDGALRGLVVVLPDGVDASYVPIRALRAVTGASWRSSPRLWIVTRGGQAVDGEPRPRVSIDHGAAWGTGRAIAEEQPDVWGGLVDLDPTVRPDDDAALLARHVLHPEGEDQVALRGGRRYALRLSRTAREGARASVTWRADAAYLVTGGLGEIGLHVAGALAAQGARRIVLLGRTALPPRASWSAIDPSTPGGRRVAAVRALESSGVAVHFAAVDVADEREVRRFLEQYAAEGWPPIRGCFHAATVLDNHLAADMDRVAWDAVLGPKLRGAQLLDRLLPDLDVFVLFSSIVAYVIVQAGEANYAAANAGLDALAHDRRARGLPAVSIGWGIWGSTGLARGRVMNEFERQGLRPFTPEQGTRLMTWLCGGSEPSVAVMPIDWGAFRRGRVGRGERLYGDLLADAAVGPAVSETELAACLAGATPVERRRITEAVVRECVARVLKIAASRVDARQVLGSLGLTSLMAIELRNRLESALGRSLSATVAYNHPTVAALVDYLVGDGAPPGDTSPAEVPSAAAGAALDTIADLSDEEAARALRGQKSRGPR